MNWKSDTVPFTVVNFVASYGDAPWCGKHGAASHGRRKIPIAHFHGARFMVSSNVFNCQGYTTVFPGLSKQPVIGLALGRSLASSAMRSQRFRFCNYFVRNGFARGYVE